MNQFHFTQFPANNVWPYGGWSVYRITGDEIAARVTFKDGEVIARDPWCGYIGSYGSLREAVEAVQWHLR